MASGLLARLPVKRIEGATVRREKGPTEGDSGRIVLRLAPAAAARLRHVAGMGRTPLAMAVDPDPEASATLVWEPGRRELSGITTDGGDDRRLGGSFLALVPSDAEDGGVTLEDGFVVTLREERWKSLMDALTAGRDVTVPPSGAWMALAVSWKTTAMRDIERSGQLVVPGGWDEFQPKVPGPPQEGPAVVETIVLLTPTQELGGRIGVAALAAHARAIEDAVRAQIKEAGALPPRDLVVQVGLAPGRSSSLWVKSRPAGLDDALERALRERLSKLPSPEVQGEVRYQVRFRLWGGTGEPFEASPGAR